MAYAEFLRANGIDDPNLLKDVDYQEVLNQQQIFGEELSLFSSNEKQKEASSAIRVSVWMIVGGVHGQRSRISDSVVCPHQGSRIRVR